MERVVQLTPLGKALYELALDGIRESKIRFPLLKLPPELLLQLPHHLYDEDVIALSRTCRQLKAIYSTYNKEHVVLSHDLQFDTFLRSALHTPDLSIAKYRKGDTPVDVDAPISLDSAPNDRVRDYLHIRHLTIRSIPSDDILVPHIRDHCGIDRHTAGLWYSRSELADGSADRITVALSFLPNLESLSLYYPHLEIYSNIATCIRAWTPNLTKLRLYVNYLDLGVLCDLMKGMYLLEELEISGLSQQEGEENERINNDLCEMAAFVFSGLNCLRHFSFVRSATDYNYEMRKSSLKSIETRFFQNLAELSGIHNSGTGLVSLELRNLNLNHKALAAYLSSPASASIRHLTMKLVFNHQDEWFAGEKFAMASARSHPHPCFWNAKCELRLDCGLSSFNHEVFEVIGPRIKVLKLWNTNHSPGEFLYVPMALRLGFLPYIKSLHVLPGFPSHEYYEAYFHSMVEDHLKGRADIYKFDFVDGDAEIDSRVEYVKGHGWGEAEATRGEIAE